MSNSYDARLFSGGLRKHIHQGRFEWLRKETRGLSGSVIELGCFNARSLQYLSFTPTNYFGLDAGWEGGLSEAERKFPNYEFMKSTDPEDIKGYWDVSLALETLEHLPRPDLLEAYLERLSLHSKIIIVTVPNEIGILFAAKFVYKKYMQKDMMQHSTKDFINHTLGRCEAVVQDQHLGFDYRRLVELINKYFVIENLEGVIGGIPRIFNTQIGIRGKSRLAKF